MSNYPGNPSLSPAVRERVQATFQQSLTLLQEGRTEEVIAGCTLILQMDPLFDPAKKLLEKARNPAMPLDIHSLVPGGGGTDPRLEQAREALMSRDFERAAHLAGEILAADPSNSDARAIGELAQEKMEAAPFVQQFVRKAEESLAAGNTALASTQLEKARSLDADHPALAALEQSIAGGAPQFAFDAPAETPSFVVDTPATPGRGTAQASDFGFTFEEQPAAAPVDSFASFSFGETTPAPEPPPAPAPAAPAAGGFSFDAPSADSPFGGGFSFDAAPAAAPATPAAPAAIPSTANEFDFSNVGAASPDDQKKIEQYLGEGDRAFDGGEYQKAIDLWSRIFLIDVTNDAASDRIERAKMRRREIESKVEGLLGTAVHAFERHDYESARRGFQDILSADPTNTTAQDYLSRIPGDGATVTDDYVPPTPPARPELDLLADEPMGGTYEPPMLPAEDDFETEQMPAAAAKQKKAAPAKAAPAPPKKKGLPIPLIAGALALIVLLGGGWFAWNKFKGGSAADPAVTEAIFTRATNYAQAGKYDMAISALQEIPADDPQRDRALGMIADFQGKKTKAAQMIDGVPAAQYYENSLAAARTAFEARDYIAAKKAFEQAMRVKQLPPDVKASYDIAAQQSAKLDSAKALFNGRRYQEAVANLEPLYAADPQNKSIQRMLIDAHFNLGATALREERLPDAQKEFDQVLQLDPSDELARRSKELATRYEGEQKDLLYRVYVKYLPYRQAV